MDIKKKIIFFYPGEMGNRPAASSLRPLKMFMAFKELGVEVAEITGSKDELREKQRTIRKQISEGERFDLIYFENRTLPLGLQLVKVFGKTVPLINITDFLFLWFCKRKGINVCYYIRDIHWLFPELYEGQLSRPAFALIRIFGVLELWKAKFLAHTLFVPNQAFADFLAKNYQIIASVLMPGCEKWEPSYRAPTKDITLLYVGGCGPLYDPRVLFEAVANTPKVKLIYCTRKEEWQLFEKEYPVVSKANNIEIVHSEGIELRALYSKADIFFYCVPPSRYGKLAFSFKIAESIGAATPVIAYKGTYVAEFITASDLGWSVDYDAESVKKLLGELLTDMPQMSRSKWEHWHSEFLWSKRAEAVLSVSTDNASQ